MSRHDLSWVPARELLGPLEVLAVSNPRRPADAPWRCERPGLAGWPAAARSLRTAGAALRDLPVRTIVAAIDEVARRWCDRAWPVRQRARDRVVAATGFSAEAVERSFDVELRNYRAESLWAVLRRELGEPAALDGFAADAHLGGATRAVGPALTLLVLTGNVPGLPALSLVRALLVKSAVIAKVASGEPTFASAFVESLAEVEPRLASAVLVTYWRRDEEEVLRAVLAEVDAVIGYGGVEACAALRRLLAPHHVYVEHGHRLSMGYIGRAYRQLVGGPELAQRVVRDVCTFNQQACIAAQAYFVQGDEDEVRHFAGELVQAMRAYGAECPVGTLTREEAAAMRYARLVQRWRLAGRAGELLEADDLGWLVSIDTGLDLGGAQPRFLRIVRVADREEFVAALAVHRAYLQNIALGATGSELRSMAEALALLGASRIAEPGRMADPSMIWRHDGQPCVARLLRWCDLEMHSHGREA